MAQSDSESLSDTESREAIERSPEDSGSSKESYHSNKDDNVKENSPRESESIPANVSTKNESGTSTREVRSTVKRETSADETGMDNMFASVWVKVEMEEEEKEPDEDMTDVNYEPPSTRRMKKKRKEMSNNSKDVKKARKCPTKVLKCQVCDYTTVYKTGLIMHMIGHTTEKKYCCSECNYKSKYRNALTRHIRIEHQAGNEAPSEPKNKFKCDQCDYTANFKWNLKAHKRKHNIEKQYKCDNCNFETAYRHNFLKHSRTHASKDKPMSFYKCDKCPFVTKYEGHITRHLAKIHNEVTDTAYKCETCDFSTRVKWRLNIHRGRSKQDNILHCPHCHFETYYMCEHKKHKVLHYDVVYGNKSDYTETHNSQIDATTGFYSAEQNVRYKDDYVNHQNETQKEYTTDPNCIDWKNIKVLESDDKERPFQCLMCTYTSRYKAAVKRHYQRHHTGTRNRPYECIHCGFSTKTKDKISLHNRRSKSDINLACPVCEYNTFYKCQYVIHQKEHYENKCSDCEYSAKRKYELQKHYLTVHMGNGLKCQFCDYTATRKESLLCHETIHTGSKPFKCNFCDYTGVRSYLLNKHMKRYHSNFMTDIVVVSESKIESLKHEALVNTVSRESLDFS
ncbi:zinc finger protein 808 [Amyelois transitella]|uniref:zinc finger protein 808 n=1 Tax=Amyelois transitella TaxID=680683 RepID=UPI00067AF1E3|nr:zinc finger protein 808 [Amyelois transitella]